MTKYYSIEGKIRGRHFVRATLTNFFERVLVGGDEILINDNTITIFIDGYDDESLLNVERHYTSSVGWSFGKLIAYSYKTIEDLIDRYKDDEDATNDLEAAFHHFVFSGIEIEGTRVQICFST